MAEEHRTKQVIRAAARQQFAEHGYNAVSMREIAQAVGKQPGGIYNHFPNKQSILVDLMQENLVRAYEAVISPIKDTASPVQRLEMFVRGHVQYHIENPDDIFIAYMELRSLEAEGAAHIMAERDKYESALRNILRDGLSADQFKLSDPAIHARSILSMLGGVTVWFRQSGPQSSTHVAECYVQAALQSVAATYVAQNERQSDV
ncbi:MAG: TetR/AcrR family transcriptional regulator [Octadecabacter sp.]|nr:TetR/AcrR family transcriptional regulator [Octadecabacter sp.]